jgi:hypothetical protein
VTLSICGLGWLDETEVESIRGAEHVAVDTHTGVIADEAPAFTGASLWGGKEPQQGDIQDVEAEVIDTATGEVLQDAVSDESSDETRHAIALQKTCQRADEVGLEPYGWNAFTALYDVETEAALTVEQLREVYRQLGEPAMVAGANENGYLAAVRGRVERAEAAAVPQLLNKALAHAERAFEGAAFQRVREAIGRLREHYTEQA